MKIFHCVESYFPSVGGMQEVVKQLSERLVKLGHEVIVLTRFHPQRDFKELNGVKIKTFCIEGNPKKAETENDQEYVDFLLSNSSDIITFFAAQQWATNLALPLLKKINAKKVSVPTGYSGLYWPEFKSYFEDMKTWIHDYDMNVYLSNDYRDINFARENNVKHLTLIPNGAGEDEFLVASKVDVRKELKIDENHFLLLLVGSYTGWKGHKEAIELFLRSDLKNATLLMIGNNYESFKMDYLKNPLLSLLLFWNRVSGRKKIIFKYLPREFTVAAYKQANLFLFPSNIECSPIVLFECAAARLPFLSTDVGNSREIAEWTKGGEILPTHKDANGFSHVIIKEGVHMLNKMYEDQIRRDKMGKQAFEIWKQKYSWEAIAKEYEKLYLNLLSK
ncbi:MAG: glycosyltransferase family 4 protein [Bacteroidetes bacterium]|nr:glycosyltransferase family 4 protein [Bacteroidota bacterium]